MRRQPPPPFRPGPLLRPDCERLNQAFAYLYGAVGGVCPAPPLEGGWDAGGLTLRVNMKQVAQTLGSSSYPVTIDTSQFTTVSPTWTFAVASSTWTFSYTTQLTLSFVGGPLIISGGYPVVLNDVLYYTETTASWGADQNNYALPATTATLRVTVTAAGGVKLTGMDPGSVTAGYSRLVWVTNDVTSSGNLTLTHQDTNSTAAKRFNLPNAQSYLLGPGEAVGVYCSGTEYQAAAASWNCLDNLPGAVNVVPIGGTITPTATPAWYKVSVPYTFWTGDGPVNDQHHSLCTLAAGSVMLAPSLAAYVTPVAYAGTTTALLDIGRTGAAYQDMLNSMSVISAAPTAVTFGVSQTINFSMTATQNVEVRLVTTGGTGHNALTAGNVDVYLYLFRLP